MTCEDMLKALNDYVDGKLDPAICEEFRQEIEGCNPCQVVVDNIRKTIQLYQNGEPYEMPAEFHRRLHDQLRDRWKAKFRQSAK